VNAVLTGTGIVDKPLALLYSDGAVIFGIAYSLVPYAVLSLYATISQIDAGLLTAAQSMGASRVRAVLGIAFPLARGGIVTSMALVFILSIGFYVTPVLLGGPQTSFMATYVAEQITKRYDYAGAAASASVLLVVAIVVVGGVMALVGRGTFKRAIS
jgi:putative spermidine/putrescine transport system permease protein